MKRIQTPLPSLGPFAIDFHEESARVLALMGDKELERLRTVSHLGVAASVFTGINHSRLEYALLQCAVIMLVAKLHRSQEHLALSSFVKLDGLKKEVSSGEELLKCWALLSNYGHAQFTYGTERSLLQFAQKDVEFRKWLTHSLPLKNMSRWASSIIDGYDDGQIHYLISLKRIEMLSEWHRHRRTYAQYIRNLVLPIDELHSDDPQAQYKLFRLRHLFARIRLVCIVALDSHYSHQPIALQLNSTILGLAELISIPGIKGGFDLTLGFVARIEVMKLRMR